MTMHTENSMLSTQICAACIDCIVVLLPQTMAYSIYVLTDFETMTYLQAPICSGRMCLDREQSESSARTFCDVGPRCALPRKTL